jgi:hypothetical protein
MRTSPFTSPEGLSFTDYFKLTIDIEEVLAYFGYTHASAEVVLPHYPHQVPWYDDLYQRIQASIPYISLTSEAARREFLIAPVLIDLARYNHVKVKVEFPLEVSFQLRGTIDYFIQAKRSFLVIEAKNADLQRGFVQLAAELMALDQWTEEHTELLYGAVSIGNIWQFGKLDRSTKHITQDLNLYRVPADLHELLQILLGVLGEAATEEPE